MWAGVVMRKGPETPRAPEIPSGKIKRGFHLRRCTEEASSGRHASAPRRDS